MGGQGACVRRTSELLDVFCGVHFPALGQQQLRLQRTHLGPDHPCVCVNVRVLHISREQTRHTRVVCSDLLLQRLLLCLGLALHALQLISRMLPLNLHTQHTRTHTYEGILEHGIHEVRTRARGPTVREASWV